MYDHPASKKMGAASYGRALALVTVTCVTACQSAPPPEQMARTTLQTAPADLQLLCSNAVANVAKVDSSKVLPVSSGAIDAQFYTVELNASGRRFNCAVDNNGVIKSVQPVL